MTLWLINEIRKVLIAIHSKQSLGQLALGVSFGVLLGLLPKGFLAVLVLIPLFFFDLNLAVAFFVAVLTTFLTPLLDPFLDASGAFLLLDVVWLQPLWLFLTDLPIVPYTRFNNTLILGSFVWGVLLMLPVFLVSKQGFFWYRNKVKAIVDKNPYIVKFKQLKWVAWLSRLLEDS